jgi:hypothetical protein
LCPINGQGRSTSVYDRYARRTLKAGFGPRLHRLRFVVMKSDLGGPNFDGGKQVICRPPASTPSYCHKTEMLTSVDSVKVWAVRCRLELPVLDRIVAKSTGRKCI